MTDTKPEGPLIEKLAAIEHARWARWHKYCRNNWTSENVERWDRQADTEYRDLSEQEKEADRREVREYYGIVFDAGRASRDRLRKALAIFAKEADEWEPHTSDSVKLQGRLMGWTGAKGHIDQMEETLISVGDLRKAKEALAEDEKEGK